MSDNSPFPRPGGSGGFICATPGDEAMINLLGGESFDGVVFTRDQLRRLYKVYGYTQEYIDQQVQHAEAEHTKTVEKWEAECASLDRWKQPPPKPKPHDPDKLRRFYETGSNLGVFRNTQRDGLRLMAFLSKFLEPGQDPVKLIVQLASDAGYDVCDDIEWAED